MPKCYRPDEVGGATHFEPVPESLSDWIPTQDHIQLKSEGGKLIVDNVRLAHRLCNRIHYNQESGTSANGDLARVEAARTFPAAGERFSVLREGQEIATARTYEEVIRWADQGVDEIVDTQARLSISPAESPRN